SRFLRRFTFAMAALIVVAIGLSRMYLGVHYPTDVLAGFVMGLAWAAFCALMIEALRYFRHREPAVALQGQDLDATIEDGPAGAGAGGRLRRGAAGRGGLERRGGEGPSRWFCGPPPRRYVRAPSWMNPFAGGVELREGGVRAVVAAGSLASS